MDLQVALIGIGIFVGSGIILLLVSMFGIKEKSYEEALAEQRQQTNALLGQQTKSKPKDNKKQKKAGKKVKEKQSNNVGEKDATEDSENTESTSPETATPEHHGHHHGKLHVEFNKEPSVIVVDSAKEVKDVANQAPQTKKRNKKDKVRPILINNKEKAHVDNELVDGDIEVPPANHFEQIHPKDEFELMHLHIKEESHKQESHKQESHKQESPKEQPKEQQPAKEKQNKGKNADKKEKEKASKHQQPPQHTPPSVEVVAPAPVVEAPEPEVVPPPVVVASQQQSAVVANSGKDKKKKKSEFNVLQQLAGDNQGIVNLSTLLTLVRKAELSRNEVQILIDLLLNKQHEAPVMIDEWTEGKTDPVQKLKKQLAEKEKALADEQDALVGSQAKLREVRTEQAAERGQFQQRIRGLEETLQAKMMDIQTFNTRNHSQTQKITMLTAQLNEEAGKMRQLMEEHNGLQLKIQQMELKLGQTQEIELAHQNLQDLNVQINNQLIYAQNLYKKELDAKDEFIRQLEDQVSDWEHRMAASFKQENDLKAEVSQLKSACQQHVEEVRRLEHSKTQVLEDTKSVQKQKEESEKYIAQLKADLEKAQQKNVQLEESRVNGSVEENKAHKVEILNLHNELSSVKMQLQQTEKKYKTELDSTVIKLSTELDEQKTKNNELRQKNWKVMEALNAAENRIKATSPTKNSSGNPAEEVLKAQKQEQEFNRKFIQRLFPDIQVADNLPQEEWLSAVEKAIGSHVSGLSKTTSSEESEEIPNLKAEIQRYQAAISESADMLTMLQGNVEAEELNWRMKLDEKETELKELKKQHELQLQSQVSILKQQLEAEQTVKRELIEKSRESDIQQLSEKVNRLQEQLELEQTKNMELLKSQQEAQSNIIKAQNHNTTNGTTISAEQMLTTSSSAASSLTEVALKPKNKKKKKKNNIQRTT